MYARQSRGKTSSHFNEGFVKAYVDVAQGETSTAPVVAPEQYWNVWHRTEARQAQASEWFEGYKIGAAMAESEGLKEFSAVPVSTVASADGGSTVETAGATYRAGNTASDNR